MLFFLSFCLFTVVICKVKKTEIRTYVNLLFNQLTWQKWYELQLFHCLNYYSKSMLFWPNFVLATHIHMTKLVWMNHTLSLHIQIHMAKLCPLNTRFIRWPQKMQTMLISILVLDKEKPLPSLSSSPAEHVLDVLWIFLYFRLLSLPRGDFLLRPVILLQERMTMISDFHSNDECSNQTYLHDSIFVYLCRSKWFNTISRWRQYGSSILCISPVL